VADPRGALYLQRCAAMADFATRDADQYAVRIAFYRNKAAKARERARRAFFSEARMTFLQIAESYESSRRGRRGHCHNKARALSLHLGDRLAGFFGAAARSVASLARRSSRSRAVLAAVSA
jgi:hypothetical protein